MTDNRRTTTDTDLRAYIGKAIRLARTARGLTQTELAAQIAVTQGQVAKYEAGSDLPSLNILIMMAHKLAVTLDILVGRTEPVEAPTVVMKYGRPGSDGVIHDKDRIAIPLISLEKAASWRAMPLGAKDIATYVSAPLFHFKDRAGHRLACIRSKSAIPPLVASDAILCLDYTDIPPRATDRADRGLFLARDNKKIRICKVLLSGNNIILSDDPIRSVDLRRQKSPLLARVIWVCQPLAPLVEIDALL